MKKFNEIKGDYNRSNILLSKLLERMFSGFSEF